MLKTILCAATLFVACGTGAAFADKAAADACAAGLDAEGKAIYGASLGGIGSGDLTAVLTTTTKRLVKAGTVSRGTARSAASAAGRCLAMAG